MPGALDALLRDTGRLYALLTHHVVSGIVMLRDVTSGSIKTIGGASLVATRAEGHVFVNGVSISRADIEASNGVMHVVDQVILPGGKSLSTPWQGAGTCGDAGRMVPTGLRYRGPIRRAGEPEE